MDSKYKIQLQKHVGELTKDVPKLSLKECTPGKINVCGGKAWPVLIAEKGGTFLAAAELGDGRIVAASHDAFSENITKKTRKGNKHCDVTMEKLQLNILRWLSKGVEPNSSEIFEITSLTQLLEIPSQTKVIVYNGRFLHGDPKPVERKMIDFIQKGGGFFHSITPWGYLQIHKGNVENILFFGVLKRAGLLLTEEFITLPQDETPIIEMTQNYLALATEENKSADYTIRLENVTKDVLKDINLLPPSGAPGFMIVYSDEAYPLVLGSDGKVFITASELSSGRIISLPHTSYGDGLLNGTNSNKQVKKLQENMISWLSKESVTKREMFENGVLEVTNDASVGRITKETKVLFWNHNDNSLSPESEKIISDFVESGGGGLLHLTTPWAYYNYVNPDYIPLLDILRKSGITCSDKYDLMYGNDDGFPIVLNDEYFSLSQKANLFQACYDEEEFLTSGVILPYAKYLPSMLICRADFQEELHRLHNNNFASSKNPTIQDPVTSNEDKSMVTIHDVLSRQRVNGLEIAHGAKTFPGLPNISESIPEHLQKKKIVELQVESSPGKDSFATGFFLHAGEFLKIEVLSGSYQGWFVKIGSHTDILYPDSQSELKRFSHIATHKAFDGVKTEICSPYGGLIYLENPEQSSKSAIKLRLSNVFYAPNFDLRSIESVNLWNERKLSPGPWADVSGEFVTITLPRSSIQNVTNLSDVMRMWDRIVRRMHFLRGTEITEHRRQWIVTDAQPSAGYMHAGYPIVTHMDIADPNNNSFILGGNWGEFWGYYHELGHNFQRDAWNFTGAIEVTCNIFSMYIVEKVTGNSPMKGAWVQDQIVQIKNCLQSGDYSFTKWQEDPLIGVGIYAELCEHLGWGCICHVLRQYEALDKENTPLRDQEKIDMWFTTCSKASEYNLAPLFDFWEWPISDKATAEVSDLVLFLPEDEITQSVPARVEKVKSKYPGLVRSITQKDFPYQFETTVTTLKDSDY